MPAQRCILLLPDFTNHVQIEGYRARFDPLAQKIAPHVTLVFPFEAPQLNSETLLIHVAEKIRTFAPFALEAAVPTAGECIYLPITVGADHVRRLHDSLYSGPLFPFLRPDLRYIPHVTIGRPANEKILEDALHALRELSGPFTARIREMIVERIAADGSSTIEARLPLANA